MAGKINSIHAMIDVSTYDTTAVDISASLPDYSGEGEALAFLFDGAQDVDFYLGDATKTLSMRIGAASQWGDFGPLNADKLRQSGQTYLWASGAASAGTISILFVSAS